MRIFKVIVCSLLMISAAFAQSDRGTITGTIADPAGAVVPNANVVLVSTETGAQYTTVSTSTGNYTLASIPAGTYDLSVESPGFKRIVQTGILVAVAQTARVDVALQVGAASESVTVEGTSPLLKTESAEQSHTMTGERIGNLPINFGVISGGYVRSPFAFITMEPGANNTGQNVIRVNGAPNSTQSMYFEGQDATNSNSAARIDELQPSVEAIEAAALQTSNFSAEYGQIVGGLFNFNAKSGTNNYHGTLYEYLVNDKFNAGLTFTDDGKGNLIRPRQRKNDFGFSVGGPISIPKLYNGKNRSFFFLGWEFYKESKVIDGIFQTVPTAQMRQGDFSQILTGRVLGTDPLGRNILENQIFDPQSARTVNGLIVYDPFPDNKIPLSRISPVASKIQNLLPLPSNALLVNNWTQSYSAPKFQSVPSIKLDHYINEKQKISFYFSRFRTDQYVNPDGLGAPVTQLRILYERNDTTRLNYDYTLSPSMLLHVGAGYIRYRNPDVAIDDVLNYDAVSQLGLVGGIPTNFAGKLATGFPRLTGLGSAFGGLGTAAAALPLGPSNANKYFFDKPTGVVNLTYVRGNHNYKFGVNWRIDGFTDRNVRGSQGIYGFTNIETAQPSNQTLANGTVGFPYASFLLGLANTASVQTPQDPQFRKTSWSLFVQDTWKVTRKLTIDYGLRWDLQGAPKEIHDRVSQFSPTTPNPSAGGLLGAVIYAGEGAGRCNCPLANTYPYAIGPRLGAAYQITSKTVLRAGWGLTYGATTNFNYITNNAILGGASIGFNQISYVAPGYAVPAATFAQGLPYTQAQLNPTSLDPGIRPLPNQINSPPYMIDVNGGRPPRISQWNIALQQQVGKNISMEAAYVGNRGAWLQSNNLVDLNGLTPQRLAGFGIDITNPAQRALLTANIASPQVVAAGFKVPYAGFPTGLSLAQALRPYPQFGNIPVFWAPRGNSWYDALQAKVIHRPAHGLDLQYSFTWQKELTTAENVSVNDVYNLKNQKSISPSSIPLVSAISFSYEVPKWGGNRYVKAVVSNWRIGGALRYQSGLPIQSPFATNGLGNQLLRLVSPNVTYANRTGEPLFLKDPNCHCFDPNATFVLNPAAWSQPAAGTFGTAAPYYNDYRWQRQPSESLSFGREFPIREGMSFSIRGEFFNVFNRVFLTAPTNTNAAATQVTNNGRTISGFGYINTSVTSIQTGGAVPTVRNGQIVARFRW